MAAPSIVVVRCRCHVPSTELKAQTTPSGTLTGVVTDQTNAVVPNAETELRDLPKSTILNQDCLPLVPG